MSEKVLATYHPRPTTSLFAQHRDLGDEGVEEGMPRTLDAASIEAKLRETVTIDRDKVVVRSGRSPIPQPPNGGWTAADSLAELPPLLAPKPELTPDLEANAFGGKGSKRSRYFTAADPLALMALGEVLRKGAEKYKLDNWRACSVDEHLDHLANHFFKVLAQMKGLATVEQDEQREDILDHLRHIQTRAHMALAVYLQGGPDAKYA